MKTLKLLAGTFLLCTLFLSCNKNEYPPEIIDQEFNLDENSPAGTVIGMVEASDRDEGQVLTFEIVDGNDEGICAFQANGTLEVKDPANLDFEKLQQIVLTVSVSDEHKKEPLESAAKIRINILDLNEFAPTIESRKFTIDENPNNGMIIGTVTATDQESHQNLYYRIEGSNNDVFGIDSISGTLSVLDSSAFDYESNESLAVTVWVRDDHANSLSAAAEITILLNDLLEEKQYTLFLQPDGASGKDAVVSAIVPENNYGALEEIMLYAWTQGGDLNVSRTIIDFDLSEIPADAKIDSAHLSLYYNPSSAYASQHSGETRFTIQRLISAWDESTVTWGTQPAATYSNIVIINGASTPFQDFPQMNITALIQDYTNDPLNSHGLVLKFMEESPYKNLILSSSDYPIEHYRPKLEVYYTVLE